MSIDNVFTEDLVPISDTVADTSSQQATVTHWLPSAANSHAPIEPCDTSPQLPKVSAHADFAGLTLKIESSSTSRCTYLRYLCHVRGPVTDRSATHGIYKSTMLTHIFMLDLDILQCFTLHDLINSMEDSDNTCLWDTEENEDGK